MDASLATSTLQDALNASTSLVSAWGLSVLGAIAVFIVGRWIARMLKRGTVSALERGGIDSTLIPFLSSAVYYGALAIVLVAVLNLFGIQTTSIIAILGAASLAIGLALQGTLSNFAAGTMLLIFRPFRIGDYVEVAGSSGSVAEIGVFTTQLNTPDNIQVTIPNSAVYGATIRNYSVNETRRIDLSMGIAYSDDIGRAIAAMRGVIEAHPGVLKDPEPTIAVSELGDSSVNFVVRPWCRNVDYWDVRFALIHQMKDAIEAAGCSIPFPQRDLHVISDQAEGAA
jgi:small conductance mechanosensitive channel